MRWETGRRSINIEDRRGMGGGGRRGAGIGIGSVILALIAMFFGIDPSIVLDSGPSPYLESPPAQVSPADERSAELVSVVLADTEETWGALFQQQGARYVEPRLVLFSGAVESACGYAQAAVGPFYCPLDQKIYIDLSFYEDLRTQLGAPGEFAQAYVLAHEVGHHVQNLLGISSQVQSLQRRVSRTEANQLSVMLELQADCFAGVWGHNAQIVQLETGDLEAALNAAAAIGDDRLQRRSQGYVVPESFTHGSSAQRVRWFRQGVNTGDPEQCNTFEAQRL
ncbi:KPN_02809 family neutral zinc metallopeptidase [Leptolyngbya sp. AN02str]|uniref:KPN_02809 family neutral zinc metallopeptidase n=1 Tax=Leptolyngbya sp. AN02str TaxID=3423363 RepID=UPI003D3174AE